MRLHLECTGLIHRYHLTLVVVPIALVVTVSAHSCYYPVVLLAV
jgi:hypothetical protein